MKAIGELLRESRKSKGYSLDDLSRETKIKTSFIAAIERHQWDNLPEFTVVSGFVKNLADALSIDKQKASAFLRRDYPLKKEISTPTQVMSERYFQWSPRLSVILMASLVVLITCGYLFFQYRNFTQAPSLIVDSPVEGQTVGTLELPVSGKTDPGSTVRVNNQPAFVDDEGNFETIMTLLTSTTKLEIKAISRSGKETLMYRTIQVVTD